MTNYMQRATWPNGSGVTLFPGGRRETWYAERTRIIRALSFGNCTIVCTRAATSRTLWGVVFTVYTVCR